MWSDAGAVVFSLATLLIAYFSRASLPRPRSHGFYRFFVFEAVMALFLINAAAWFRDPFSWHQLISWSLLVGSLVPLVMGVRALHVHGGSHGSTRQEPELLGFERTSRLVSEGIFRYIRHPMYSSLLLFAWGLFFKAPSAAGVALAGLASVVLMLMAKVEEVECQRAFGAAYKHYMTTTKRFIPYLF